MKLYTVHYGSGEFEHVYYVVASNVARAVNLIYSKEGFVKREHEIWAVKYVDEITAIELE